MIRVAICTPYLDHGDAVSNDVIGMYQALIENGFEAAVFAQNGLIPYPHVHQPEALKDFIKSPHDILIYHHSVGWDSGIHLLRSLKCCKVVKYHNITPPEFFEGIANNYFIACRFGRTQLKDIVKAKADLYLADSTFNLNELLAQGYPLEKCGILPPFHHINRLTLLEADASVVSRFNDGKTNLLVVGRLSPNKGHLALIDTFSIYHLTYNQESRLIIVGKEDPGLASYKHSLKMRIRELDLENSVFFAGHVQDKTLKAYYLVAHVFIITSLHEGFCVPLVEAMSMKIPIVAYGSTAIPETVGKVGFVWKECDPELMAASVDRIVQDEFLRSSLVEMGLNRYQSMFTNSKIKERLFESLRMANLID